MRLFPQACALIIAEWWAERGIRKAAECCLVEATEQGARRHEHSYHEGMEAGAFNCRARILELLPQKGATP